MIDPRPLSERFDLTYIRRRHFADRWIGITSVVVAGLLAIYFGGLLALGDQTAFSSGPLTHSHAMFADDCSKCHAPDTSGNSYWLGVRDELCLNCHVAASHNALQSRFVGGSCSISGMQIMMSSSCSECHVEHRGADADPTAVADVTCVQCHADLERLGWSRSQTQSNPSGAPHSIFAHEPRSGS